MKKLPSDAEMAEANARFREAQRGYAMSLRYDDAADTLILVLRSGSTLTIPRAAVVELRDATRAELGTLELSASGGMIRCEPIDVDISVPGLVRDMTGAAAWLSRAGGRKTEAKSLAARENGKRGGRPRKAASGDSARR